MIGLASLHEFDLLWWMPLMDVFKKGMISWITTTCICIVSNRDVDAVRYRYASIPYSADYCTYSDLVPTGKHYIIVCISMHVIHNMMTKKRCITMI
jgi:hypothetical protein